jgi:hypothetical protein
MSRLTGPSSRRDNTITHVLLDEGHLWGEKRVAIPIGAVANIKDGVSLSVTKEQVRELPAVRLDRQTRQRDTKAP